MNTHLNHNAFSVRPERIIAMYDIVIKGGRLIDPSEGINEMRDIGISQDRIADVSHIIDDAKAGRIIDARGKIATPGLIDLHVHAAHGVSELGLDPDGCGIRSGITTLCDCGSTGIANFASFRTNVISRATTDVFCLLHVVPEGLAVIPERWSLPDIDPAAMLTMIEENRDVIKGIKIRATGALVKSLGLEGIKIAKKTASDAGVPLMIHLGAEPEEPVSEEEMDSFTIDMLNLLDEGDILTHVYTWKKGGVIKPDGKLVPGFKDALERGVRLDVANARFHYSADIARIALDQGIVAHTMSTDLTALSFHTLVFSLLVTMSKFLAIGFDLELLIKMTTVNPAMVLTGGKDRGSLRKGMPADVSILELKEGDFLFSDGIEGKTFKGGTLITPVLTLKQGKEFAAESRYVAA
jgi:dihydroorotase